MQCHVRSRITASRSIAPAIPSTIGHEARDRLAGAGDGDFLAGVFLAQSNTTVLLP
jgi:hypothetical protein